MWIQVFIFMSPVYSTLVHLVLKYETTLNHHLSLPLLYTWIPGAAVWLPAAPPTFSEFLISQNRHSPRQEWWNAELSQELLTSSSNEVLTRLRDDLWAVMLKSQTIPNGAQLRALADRFRVLINSIVMDNDDFQCILTFLWPYCEVYYEFEPQVIGSVATAAEPFQVLTMSILRRNVIKTGGIKLFSMKKTLFSLSMSIQNVLRSTQYRIENPLGVYESAVLSLHSQPWIFDGALLERLNSRPSATDVVLYDKEEAESMQLLLFPMYGFLFKDGNKMVGLSGPMRVEKRLLDGRIIMSMGKLMAGMKSVLMKNHVIPRRKYYPKEPPSDQFNQPASLFSKLPNDVLHLILSMLVDDFPNLNLVCKGLHFPTRVILNDPILFGTHLSMTVSVSMDRLVEWLYAFLMSINLRLQYQIDWQTLQTALSVFLDFSFPLVCEQRQLIELVNEPPEHLQSVGMALIERVLRRPIEERVNFDSDYDTINDDEN